MRLRALRIKILVAQDQRALGRKRTLLCDPEGTRMAQAQWRSYVQFLLSPDGRAAYTLMNAATTGAEQDVARDSVDLCVEPVVERNAVLRCPE